MPQCHHVARSRVPSSRADLLVLLFLSLASFPGLFPTASAQFALPASAANLTTVRSPIDRSISISYKSPNGSVCRTAFDHQRQYTGWVNVPGEYPTNLFFWLVEARQPTDMLTIWLNGGPGASSLFGMFNGVGPCEVVEAGLDQYDTLTREWGWDRASNMLFIDQPNQVGFSFDTPTNGSVHLLNGTRIVPPVPAPDDGLSHATFINGTFGSLDYNATANTTEQAAMAVWHMLQGFLATFPSFNPSGRNSIGINLFAESYGGKFGPVFSHVWEQQNAKRRNGSIPRNSTLEIRLASLGIVNGCIDDAIQAPYYPAFALSNTYDFRAISSVRANLANNSFYADGGCLDLIRQCRTAEEVHDPDGTGTVDLVNEHCSRAYRTCYDSVVAPYADAGRSWYDMAHVLPDSFPPATYLEYLNTRAVQEAIGAVTNFTFASREVAAAFQATGDYVRGSHVPRLASLLDAGIRVAFIYGDRDYVCNWPGGEAVADAVAWNARDAYGPRFAAAGYAPLIVNDSYIGGVVRQFGNLSFSRIYQAGHSVPSYQPETAFQLFARVALGTSVSTGDAIDPLDYATEGDDRADRHRDDLPDSPGPTCWLRNVQGSCSRDQIDMLERGDGVVLNGVLYEHSSDWPLAGKLASSPSTSVGAGAERTTTSTPSRALTGIFTATATPDSGQVRSRNARDSVLLLGLALCCAALGMV
ncbi:carboxypeptidase S1 [Sodiomyces alkalinus F11]|uniref:Carboxypeptidase S1 n=1 Tax=Sodiomyces alkalinus (strain CBS 110278 / VKM F-3762 / F11) TaxID=1314773 RepID=A0A3N2PP52_SODAK|nr:carboxypeptidase S1 [Sodiomyces alkalinus F11]ROT36279.1 carboxypeptidase S1 [Sodiomyces alkalinus F11]